MLSYSLVLFVFVGIPTLILVFISLSVKVLNKQTSLYLLSLSVIAVLYTTPWDNYLVYHSVWYYDQNKIWNVFIWFVPLEEYLFFVIQTWFTGLVTLLLIHNQDKIKNNHEIIKVPSESRAKLTWVINEAVNNVREPKAILLISLTVMSSLLLWLFKFSTLFYFLLITAWALYPITLQLVVGFRFIGRYGSSLLAGVTLTSLYLCIVDYISINDKVWEINKLYTINGLGVGVLPFEEIWFFIITNVLVSLGIILFSVIGGISESVSVD